MEESQGVDIIRNPKENFFRCNNLVNTKHGVNNWILIFFSMFVINYVIENYLSYGIRVGPMQMTNYFIIFLQNNWWIYGVILGSFVLQMVFCFLIEKLLSLGILSERTGMTLHGLNALLSFNVSAVLFTACDFNPVAAVGIVTHLFLKSLKIWGYAYTNKQLREKYVKEDSTIQKELVENTITEKGANDSIPYPKNVTLQNVVRFMLCTAACTYNAKPIKIKSPKYKKILVGLLKSVVLHYFMAFLMYQYLIPEANKAVSYIDNREYLKLLGSLLKIAFPGNILWLSHFYFHAFGVYLHMFGWISGLQHVTLQRDWWNSENTSEFWKRWNYQAHVWFKECVFLPVLSTGYSKGRAAFVVALVSGLLHEYLVTLPCRTGYGLATFAMLMQIPLSHLTTFTTKTFGAKLSNILMWLNLILGHSMLALLVYYNYSKNYVINTE